MDRSFNPIDTVCLESFPWADLSIFQDEEMDARGTSLFLSCVDVQKKNQSVKSMS